MHKIRKSLLKMHSKNQKYMFIYMRYYQINANELIYVSSLSVVSCIIQVQILIETIGSMKKKCWRGEGSFSLKAHSRIRECNTHTRKKKKKKTSYRLKICLPVVSPELDHLCSGTDEIQKDNLFKLPKCTGQW